MESRSTFTGPFTDHSSSGNPSRLVFGSCIAVVMPIRMSADPKLVASSGQSSTPPLELENAGTLHVRKVWRAMQNGYVQPLVAQGGQSCDHRDSMALLVNKFERFPLGISRTQPLGYHRDLIIYPTWL